MPPAARSVAWQAAGSAATLAAALWVWWRFGLAAQGEFGFAKSWFDAAAAVASLGLPQGLLHLQYRRAVPAAALLRWLLRGLLVLGAAALGAAILLTALQLTLAAAIAASLPFAVAHLLARSLVLGARGVVVFGVVTAMPALLVLAGVLGYGLAGQASGFENLLFVSAVVAGSTSLAIAWRSTATPTAQAWPRRELWQVSLQSGLQAALGGALAAVLLSVVAWSHDDRAELGAASLGWHLYQLFAVVAGYLAPLIFDRLARQTRPLALGWPAPVRASATVLLVLAAAGLAASFAVPRWATWLLPVSLMLPAGLACVAARVAGTVLLARAAYVELSLQAGLRLGLAASMLWLMLHVLPAPAALASALLATELATWWRCDWLVREARR